MLASRILLTRRKFCSGVLLERSGMRFSHGGGGCGEIGIITISGFFK